MRPLHATAFALAAALLVAAAPCGAQSTALSKDLLETRSSLTAPQQAAVAQYADRIAVIFAEGDAGNVVDARNELIDLCRNVNVSDIFRSALARVLITKFEPLARSPQTFRATNAFLVAQFLRAPEALDFLLDNIDSTRQPDAGLRAAAAAQLPKTAPNVGLVPAQIDAVAKRLATAARTETNWVAIASEVETVSELFTTRLPPAQAESVAASQAAIVNNLTERVQAGTEPELVRALQRALIIVRNQLTAPQSPGKRLLDGIAPSLAAIERIKNAPPAQVKSNPQLDAAFRNVVITAELLQKLSAAR